MANKSEGFNDGLTTAAVVLAAIAILFWVVPVMPSSEYGDSIYALFSGLTDFGTEFRGRMPAFLVAAFSSIFLLQLRRR